jgi:hypothetical protein
MLANWTFSLWCVPLIKSGSLNWPWSTKIRSVHNSHVQVWRKTHYDVTNKKTRWSVWSRLMTISKWIIPLLNTAILKVETNIIANISASLIGWAGILVIMSVKDFKLTILFFYWWRHNVFYVKLAHARCISSVWKTSPMHNNVQLLMTHIYIRLKSKISTIINKHKTKNNDISLLHLVGLYYNRNSPRDYWRICPIHFKMTIFLNVIVIFNVLRFYNNKCMECHFLNIYK